MKYLLLFFSATFYGQVLHHQMLSSQGDTKVLSNGVVVRQTIGQQSIIGNSKSNKYFINQGFQQSVWNDYISSNVVDFISTKTYPNPFTNTINFHFSKPITEPIMIYVYDVSGRLVFEGKKNAIDTVLSVDLSNLPTSQYLVSLNSDTFTYYTQIIKL
ncbi:T9SS type A sorting domain-containing protein [Flavobacterium sp. K5-23]|uniref:T9SS type A sorting domain-containing protein n=1 Tax=Flavobacterium sp. K5-23 TaxID=2746225 RepID=UPI002010BDFD|nr:T9SS type A sorting domain-containing protein [Flavobacterium sp. K5-23]